MEIPKTQKNRALASVNLKMLLIALISLLLIIPLNYVQDLISERSQRQQTVVQETTSKWGKSVYVCGPILKVPYLDPISNSVEYAYFFPDELKVSMAVNVLEPLKRGLYTSTVFQSKVNLIGRYNHLDFKQKNIAQDAIYWNRSSMILQTDNLQSLKNEIVVVTPNVKLIFEPQQNKQNKSQPYLESQLFDARLIAINAPFNLNLICNGSKQITIVPVGKRTTAHLKTNWTTPKFDGYFLPSNKNITKQNTAAEWNILHFNRPFGQQSFQYLPNVKPYGFSVSFINPVDEYQQNDRAIKYGFLTIGLTFLIFFLIQTLSKINIHVFHYGMIGIALVLFYTLLIAITEHSSFAFAYAISAFSVIVLISLYTNSILKNKRYASLICSSLVALYTFIFVILQLEDYALLVGSIGLFVILATTMFFARKLEYTNKQ